MGMIPMVMARAILDGRCYGFGQNRFNHVPFTAAVLRSYCQSGCLYYVPKGDVSIPNGFDRHVFMSVRDVCILIPNMHRTIQLHNERLMEQVEHAGEFSVLSMYEIARIWDLCGGIDFQGSKARTLDVAGHSLGTHRSDPAQLNYLTFPGVDGTLHYDKQYEGVAQPDLGVVLGLRAEVMRNARVP